MFFKKKKIKMGIREGVARAVDTLVDMNMRVFMDIADVSKKMGYTIDTAENRVVFAFGLLVPQTFYAYQVFPREKAEQISKLTEYFLGTFKKDDKYVYGINGAYLDISEIDISEVYKVYEGIYMQAEDEYLKGGSSTQTLPPLKVVFAILAYVLDYDLKENSMADFQSIYDICVTKIAEHIDFWKVLDSKVDYIWTT